MTCQVLDITRTISRVGRGYPTGIDRVEHAYIREFLKRFPDAVYLAKLTRDYVVIEANAMSVLAEADFGETLKRHLGIEDAFRFKLPRQQRRARSFVRCNAKWRFRTNQAKEAIAEKLPGGFEYTNVGHSNLGVGFLSQIKPAGCTNIRIMIHDMIPLDFPQYCREKIPQEFRTKMQSVATVVDTVICNSDYTKSRVQKYFAKSPNNASYRVAYLGIESAFGTGKKTKSDPASFIILGTVEPRKNHLLLLNVWTELAKRLPEQDTPVLHIVGKRGWKNDAFFAQLERSSLYGSKIIEHGNLNDTKLNMLLGAASALLFPSFAEGYGLPAIEACAVGVPVICSDIPVFRELLGKAAYMLPCDDGVAWTSKILEISKENPEFSTQMKKSVENMKIPDWSTHFCHVFGK